MRFSYSGVAATLALVLALGAGMFATAGTQENTGRIAAYAKVRENGSVVARKSLNVRSTHVNLEATSAYCFRNLPFRFKGAVVTIDYATAETAVTEASFARGNPFGDCAGSNVDAEVATSDDAGYDPQGFYIEFYR